MSAATALQRRTPRWARLAKLTTLVTVVAAMGLITALYWAEWLGLMVPRGKPVGISIKSSSA